LGCFPKLNHNNHQKNILTSDIGGFLTRLLIVIFIIELAIMVFFSLVDLALPSFLEGLLDAFLLATLSAYPIYIWVIRPYSEKITFERTKALIEAKIMAENAQQLAEEATRMKSCFLANMSHEIRTPMNAVIGLNFLALQTELNEKQSGYISKAHHSAQNLLGIINDILDFSKMESGKFAMENTPFQFNDVIDNVTRIVSLNADEKNINISIKIDSNVPDFFVGDSLRLSQVLINLGTNAVKFSNNNGRVTFHVSLIEENTSSATLKFSVHDKGIGISPSQQKNVI